jgi:hypothetical protein
MDYTSCKVSVSGCDEKYALTDIDAGVKVRGNYTANYDKKPLRIKFNKKQGMLGLNNNLKAKSWVPLADVKDSSLLRNASAFYLGKRILGSDGYYVSDFTPVKVNINGVLAELFHVAETCKRRAVLHGIEAWRHLMYVLHADGFIEHSCPSHVEGTRHHLVVGADGRGSEEEGVLTGDATKLD